MKLLRFITMIASVFFSSILAHGAPPATPLDPQGKTVLMADSVLTPVPGMSPMRARGSRLGKIQRIWQQGWKDSAQTFTWKVSVTSAGAYEVELVSCDVQEVVVKGGEQPLYAHIDKASPRWNLPGWSRTLLGTINLAPGEHTLTLQLVKDQATAGKLRSLDLLRVAAKADHQKRVSALRSDAQWMREGKYGVMLQYGSWGYPERGPKRPWEEAAKAFDVEKFAKMVDEGMGAKWVIWSITWRGSHFPMPLESVDAIVPGHTITRDLPADLIAALKKRGIKLMFYYHPGHEDETWWAANWKGQNNKAYYCKNWQDVMTEIGNRYGDDLAGWFFDDAAFYSPLAPASFEALTKAAKSGSPKRLVSYNSWIMPTFTDFQDIHMGEMFFDANTADMDPKGIYKSGPFKGNQSHSMFTVNSPGWGVWQPDFRIPLTMSASSAVGLVKRGMERGEVISFNFDMYEDGAVTPATLDMFRQLKETLSRPIPVSQGKPASASSQWADLYSADRAFDGHPNSFWALGQSQTTGWLEVDLGKSTKISSAMIQENCTHPRVPEVSQFAIEAQQADGAWQTVVEGLGIGPKKKLAFAPVKAQKFRLHILTSKSVPTIAEFQLYEK